ncbi:MAG: DUF2267 domain-containing protein [Methyloligellaceae bacterium]
MSTTRLTNLDNMLRLTREWVQELSDRLDWGNDRRAYRLLRETLHALRDRLSINEAVHLSAQLPTLLRGIYFEGWHPAGMPIAERNKAHFVERIANAFKNDPIEDPEEAVSQVFSLLNRRISQGEIEDIKSCLPTSLHDLWPD